MSSDSPSVPASEPAAAAPTPTIFELFLAFAKISIAGFGGVLIWTRRAIVEEHHWMTAEEFNETYALCHFLPGPNVVNLSVVFGSRFRGVAGGVAAFAGLVGPPMALVTLLAALYAHFGEVDALRRSLAGVTCAAAGLLISAVIRMMGPLIKKREILLLLVMAAVFVAIGWLRLPLPWVLLVAAPISIGISSAKRRQAA